MSNAILVLEDGTVFKGIYPHTFSKTYGEIVFNTSMTGYTETFTDPSYAGQILLMTYPLIGNYGIYMDHYESSHVHIRGLVCKAPLFTAHRGNQLQRFLKKESLPCIHDIDTRALTVRIRKHGTMKALLFCDATNKKGLKELIRELHDRPHPDTDNLVARVSCQEPIYHTIGSGKTVVLIDCGVKKSIIQNLMSNHLNIIQVPYNTSVKRISALAPDGIVISNGPGDPAHPQLARTTIKTIKNLFGMFPIFGICLGHQLMGIALGLKTYKLKFGHRGTNHAVKHIPTGKVCITSQNHGYALRTPRNEKIKIDWINVNDETIEGFHHCSLPIFSVQFHPEAAPGPYDTRFLFNEFLKAIHA